MPTTTTNYSFKKPVVGADEDDWGTYLNENWEALDGLLDGFGAGGGLFKGDNGQTGSSAGDIFRINAQTLTEDVTINADENSSCTGPLTIGTGATLTLLGNLTVI